MNNVALMVLDLQRDFLEPSGRQSVGAEAEGIIRSANLMLKHAEGAGWNVVFIKNEFLRTDWIGNFLRNGASVAGSPGAEADPRILYPEKHSDFSKSKSDAFSNPGLLPHLKDGNIQNIVVLGVMAEGCVRATVRRARDLGFSVTVVTDGVGSTRPFLKRFGLKSMERAGAVTKVCSEISVP